MRHSVHAASRESAGPHSRRSQYRLPVLLETTTENWERQILPSRALSGKIKSWFKHQPKLDRFRLMIVFAARTGEHIEGASNVHPAVQADFVRSPLGFTNIFNPSPWVLATARGF